MNFFISKFVPIITIFFFLSPANAATYKNIPAIGCEAVFLDQAYDLKWDSIRLSNRHDTLSRWVVCPISRSNSSSPENGIEGYINYMYFANAQSNEADMICILREIDYAGYVHYSKTFTLPNPGAGNADYTGISIGSNQLTTSDWNYWTMSCKLPPRTALVSFDLSIED